MVGPLQQFKADFFRCLAHPVRIRILELLRGRELTVGELQAHLELDPSSVSQQLAVLRTRDVVQTRKAGTSVYYRVRDDRLYRILDAAREIFESRVQEWQGVLEAQHAADAAEGVAGPAAPDLAGEASGHAVHRG